MKNKYIIDLFCGCGGLSKGFEMAGFTPILAVDFWEDAIKTYNHNHKAKVGICEDISKLDNKSLQDLLSKKKIVGIIGGPPCQGFSTVGKRDAEDSRNYLYKEYCRIIDQVKPDFFMLENVKGLLTLKDGFFKNDIIDHFSRLGYKVVFEVVNASDYGVPQNRHRVIFVGIKNKKFEFPEKYETKISTKEAISDLIKYEDKYSSLPNSEYQKQMRKDTEKISNNEFTEHSENTREIIDMVKDGGKISDLPSEYWNIRKYNKAFQRMNSKLPSNTIDTGHRNYFHYSENRIPTVRESARIQSFSDDFVFLGSKTSQYKQVGNAVPPLLAYEIAKAIKRIIGDGNE